jgi:hypothetical protein
MLMSFYHQKCVRSEKEVLSLVIQAKFAHEFTPLKEANVLLKPSRSQQWLI